jgi:hypothetical protein
MSTENLVLSEGEVSVIISCASQMDDDLEDYNKGLPEKELKQLRKDYDSAMNKLREYLNSIKPKTK